MIARLLLPRVGFLASLLFRTAIVFGKSHSFAVDVRGHGVRFLDSSISAENVGVVTSDNDGYFTNITLGGLNLTVVLDTGSFDLVVDARVRKFAETNSTIGVIQAEEVFGRGQAVGFIQVAELRLGDFSIDSQAFLAASQWDNLNGVAGIMGTSFFMESSIGNALSEAFGEQQAVVLGRPPMLNLFTQEPDLPRNFDVQLGRVNELESSAPGLFIIGGHDSKFQGVASAPKLPSVSTEHWSLVMDSMKVNGKPFKFNASRISGTPSGKVVAALDTGFSLPPLPPAAVDAIYSSIEGAVQDKGNSMWFVPCDAATNLSFVFGGQEFFVHPLDITFPVAGQVRNADGTHSNRTACVNSYQYLTLDSDDFTGFDLILGDAFLRNVYASFNYGDLITGNGSFVQMVTTTPDLSKAMQEFKTERAATLSKLPPTVDPAVAAGLRPNGSRRTHTVYVGLAIVSAVVSSLFLW